MRAKIIFYCAVWIAALVATDPSFRNAALVYMFALGLLHFTPAPGLLNGWVALLASWSIYVVHAVFFFRARKRQLTIALGAVLVFLLICNVSGCREMLNAR